MSDGGGTFIFLRSEGHAGKTKVNIQEQEEASVVKPGDRPIAIILAIQAFTVVSQVALASILGVWHGYGFTSQFIPNYLATYCRNFIMALPVQLFLAGPIARALFRLLFRRGNGGGEKKIGREVREEGAAE